MLRLRFGLYLIPLLFSAHLYAQNFKPVQFADFEKFLAENNNDTLYVINFWATWCKPCIEELPYFEKLNAETQHEKIKVILVSMDTESRWGNALTEFIQKRNVQSEVRSFYNKKPIDWIDRISPEWSGAIPATLFLYKGNKTFHEKEFTYEELQTIIQQLKF
ncbi:MAG: TlpA family protein disulfide reductase [Fimbriimonadaceae bacterium]|nr:TlpA family protein disulfide reductase [Chitinophagales bacterium]